MGSCVINFCSWGMLEDKAYSHNPYNEDDQKRSIQYLLYSIPPAEHYATYMSVSQRKSFHAPLLHTVSKNPILAAIQMN